jgi:UDP-N-acetylmuramyl pentapeptide phosphotransferase/UDP-N-acetylglucosamine-1-phosphate transferase
LPSSPFSDSTSLPVLPYLTSGALVLFFIGIKDDILVTAPWWKLLGQVLAALIVALPGELLVGGQDYFFGIGTENTGTQVLLSVLIVVVVINSVNLIDGIDGLASGIGILASIVFGLVFLDGGLTPWVLVAAVLCGSLAGFTWYNVFSRKKKIYMGDTGSMILGFLLALMVLRIFNMEKHMVLNMQVYSPPGFILAVLIIPLFDILRIIALRVIQGRSPFRPDRQHIHYRLVDAGATHLQATAILLVVNIFMIFLLYLLQGCGEIPSILILLLISTGLSAVPGYILKKRTRK